YWEETSRGAAGLAGAQADPLFSVWLYDWRVLQTGERTFSLSAAKEGMVLELDLEDAKGPVLHGQQGYSQKGEGQGNASYYISQTRLVTRGRLLMDGEVYQVSGTSWMDHEFSTSALSGQQVGWDWFSIQLDDGREVLVYTIRNADGSLDPHSYGSLILEDGSLMPLTSRDFSIEPTGEWTSPHSGAVYPSGWRVNIPGQEVELQINPLIQDQELVVSYTYWEGAVEIQGTWRGRPVTGRGYTELTGYAESMQGQF
ncbi:MAG: lipocalin family protein, partial [Anaerolineaceae bacterium]